MIAIVDYGVGNLFSLKCSLDAIGAQAEVTGQAQALRDARSIILPGVGAFGDAIQKLRATGLDEVVAEQAKAGKPLLGICLGMQLLFESSSEFGAHTGLGLVPGRICSLADDLKTESYGYKVPHMGWNKLNLVNADSPLMKYTNEGDYAYYVHSFYARDCEQNWVATSEYGVTITGAVQNGNVYGTQFHPEKSGKAGLKMLKAFSEVV